MNHCEIKTALELVSEESEWIAPKTAIPSVDSLLENQLKPGLITELSGFPGTGKTQICFHLSVGTVGNVYYISTNKNFSSYRLKKIAESRYSQVDHILKQIFYVEANEPSDLFEAIKCFKQWLEKNNNVKLLIIDSISWILKQQIGAERKNISYTLFQDLHSIAQLYKFTVVVTNDLSTRALGGKSLITPSFGGSFFHIVNNRILLSKEGNMFKLNIAKSVNQIIKLAVYFRIT